MDTAHTQVESRGGQPRSLWGGAINSDKRPGKGANPLGPPASELAVERRCRPWTPSGPQWMGHRTRKKESSGRSNPGGSKSCCEMLDENPALGRQAQAYRQHHHSIRSRACGAAVGRAAISSAGVHEKAERDPGQTWEDCLSYWQVRHSEPTIPLLRNPWRIQFPALHSNLEVLCQSYRYVGLWVFSDEAVVTAANSPSDSRLKAVFTGPIPNCLEEVEQLEETVGSDPAVAEAQCIVHTAEKYAIVVLYKRCLRSFGPARRYQHDSVTAWISNRQHTAGSRRYESTSSNLSWSTHTAAGPKDPSSRNGYPISLTQNTTNVMARGA